MAALYACPRYVFFFFFTAGPFLRLDRVVSRRTCPILSCRAFHRSFHTLNVVAVSFLVPPLSILDHISYFPMPTKSAAPFPLCRLISSPLLPSPVRPCDFFFFYCSCSWILRHRRLRLLLVAPRTHKTTRSCRKLLEEDRDRRANLPDRGSLPSTWYKEVRGNDEAD